MTLDVLVVRENKKEAPTLGRHHLTPDTLSIA